MGKSATQAPQTRYHRFDKLHREGVQQTSKQYRCESTCICTLWTFRQQDWRVKRGFLILSLFSTLWEPSLSFHMNLKSQLVRWWPEPSGIQATLLTKWSRTACGTLCRACSEILSFSEDLKFEWWTGNMGVTGTKMQSYTTMIYSHRDLFCFWPSHKTLQHPAISSTQML